MNERTMNSTTTLATNLLYPTLAATTVECRSKELFPVQLHFLFLLFILSSTIIFHVFFYKKNCQFFDVFVTQTLRGPTNRMSVSIQ